MYRSQLRSSLVKFSFVVIAACYEETNYDRFYIFQESNNDLRFQPQFSNTVFKIKFFFYSLE